MQKIECYMKQNNINLIDFCIVSGFQLPPVRLVMQNNLLFPATSTFLDSLIRELGRDTISVLTMFVRVFQ